MNKFTKQFMNLTMVFAAVNALSLVRAFAQDIDYDAINERNNEHREGRRNSTNRTPRPQKEPSYEVSESFLIEKNFKQNGLPKNRRLTDIEKEQKDLLVCALKFIDEKKGLFDGPEVLFKILREAMDRNGLTSDSYVLNEIKSKCWEAFNSLDSYKPSKEEEEKILDNVPWGRENKLEETLADFLRTQYKRTPKCIANSITAKVGIIAGVNTGITKLKCLYPSGVVRNYIGPNLKLAINIGAAIEVAQLNIKSDRRAIGTAAAAVDLTQLNSQQEVVVGLGRANNVLNEEDYHQYNDMKERGQLVGAGYFGDVGMIGGSINIRSFNGARNWSYVIDQLK